MNKIYRLLLICCGALSVTACSDFLDTQSKSENTPEKVFNTPAMTELALNSIYADLCQDNYSQFMTIQMGAGTDVELTDGIGATAYDNSQRGYLNYNGTATGWSKLGTFWEQQYQTIQDCNLLIGGVKASETFNGPASENRTLLGRYLSEAMTIRAMVYLDLTRVFGDVPMMMEAAKSDLSNVNVGKTDRDEILDHIAEDLEYVVSLDMLPWAGTQSVEHVTMGYARALLANIYMTRAGFAIREAGGQAEGKPYCVASKLAAGYVKGAQSDDVYQTLRPSDDDCKALYQKAHTHLKAVMEKGIHQLAPTFSDIWKAVNVLQAVPNNESMYEIPMGFGDTGELGYSVGIRLKGNSSHAADYVQDFGYNNSAGNLKTNAVMFYSFEPNDQRRDVTCADFEITDYNRSESGWTTIESFSGNKPFGIYIGKWDVRKMAKSERWLSTNKVASAKWSYGINPIRMRYAQVLLWYAECENYLNGGPTTAARDALKAVHRRAYADAPAKNYQGQLASTELSNWESYIDGISGMDEFLEAICTENKLEFCGEGFRKWDLIRWNKLAEKIWGAKVEFLYKQAKVNDVAIFQEKVHFQYLKDDTGTENEKQIDWSSATWYGEDGDNKTRATKKEIGAGFTNKANNVAYYCTDSKNPDGKGPNNKGLNQNEYKGDGFAKRTNSQDGDLTSICCGLVGTDMPDGSTYSATFPYTHETQVHSKVPASNVKNRYLMPIYQNVINSSNSRLYNSYGF